MKGEPAMEKIVFHLLAMGMLFLLGGFTASHLGVAEPISYSNWAYAVGFFVLFVIGILDSN